MKLRWLIAWLVQILLMTVTGFAVAASELFGQTIYCVAAYAIMPLLGMFSACRATTRGLLNYAAWIAPPVCMIAAHIIMWGFMPEPGPALVCAFISLIGAAAGEVLNQRKKTGAKK